MKLSCENGIVDRAILYLDFNNKSDFVARTEGISRLEKMKLLEFSLPKNTCTESMEGSIIVSSYGKGFFRIFNLSDNRIAVSHVSFISNSKEKKLQITAHVLLFNKAQYMAIGGNPYRLLLSKPDLFIHTLEHTQLEVISFKDLCTGISPIPHPKTLGITHKVLVDALMQASFGSVIAILLEDNIPIDKEIAESLELLPLPGASKIKLNSFVSDFDDLAEFNLLIIPNILHEKIKDLPSGINIIDLASKDTYMFRTEYPNGISKILEKKQFDAFSKFLSSNCEDYTYNRLFSILRFYLDFLHLQDIPQDSIQHKLQIIKSLRSKGIFLKINGVDELLYPEVKSVVSAFDKIPSNMLLELTNFVKVSNDKELAFEILKKLQTPEEKIRFFVSTIPLINVSEIFTIVEESKHTISDYELINSLITAVATSFSRDDAFKILMTFNQEKLFKNYLISVLLPERDYSKIKMILPHLSKDTLKENIQLFLETYDEKLFQIGISILDMLAEEFDRFLQGILYNYTLENFFEGKEQRIAPLLKFLSQDMLVILAKKAIDKASPLIFDILFHLDDTHLNEIKLDLKNYIINELKRNNVDVLNKILENPKLSKALTYYYDEFAAEFLELNNVEMSLKLLSLLKEKHTEKLRYVDDALVTFIERNTDSENIDITHFVDYLMSYKALYNVLKIGIKKDKPELIMRVYPKISETHRINIEPEISNYIKTLIKEKHFRDALQLSKLVNLERNFDVVFKEAIKQKNPLLAETLLQKAGIKNTEYEYLLGLTYKDVGIRENDVDYLKKALKYLSSADGKTKLEIHEKLIPLESSLTENFDSDEFLDELPDYFNLLISSGRTKNVVSVAKSVLDNLYEHKHLETLLRVLSYFNLNMNVFSAIFDKDKKSIDLLLSIIYDGFVVPSDTTGTLAKKKKKRKEIIKYVIEYLSKEKELQALSDWLINSVK